MASRSEIANVNIPEDIEENKIQNLLNRTGYTLIQKNGQRKYGGPPPNWKGPPPLKGSEVFVGRLPRDVLEDVLVPIFESVGPIYELRLMVDYNGNNRGYCFVMYANPQLAVDAIRKLNRHEIRPNKFIGVIKSLDNRRLFIGGIPKDKTADDVRQEMTRISDGVADVILYSAVADKTKNRGFAFVEYNDHRAAAVARRHFYPNRLFLWGKELALDWAEPEPVVDDEILSKVTVLYVRNLMMNTKEEELRDLFNNAGDDGVEKVKVMKDFAFVHFSTRDKAAKAMATLSHADIHGSTIQITWAKPVMDRKRYQLQKTLCKAAVARNNVALIATHAAHHNNILPTTNTFNGTRTGRNSAGMCGGYGLQRTDTLHNRQKYYAVQWGGENQYKEPDDKVKMLGEVCRWYQLSEPVYEMCQDFQNRTIIKVIFPDFNPLYNTVHMYTDHGRDAYQVAAEVGLGHLFSLLYETVPNSVQCTENLSNHSFQGNTNGLYDNTFSSHPYHPSSSVQQHRY